MFDNNHNFFTTELDIRERLDELETNIGPTVGVDLKPQLFIRQSLDRSLDFGVVTPESWKKVGLVGDNEELLVVAKLPHFAVWSETTGTSKLETQLKDAGWTEETLDAEERLAGFPRTLGHKYFTVQFTHV